MAYGERGETARTRIEVMVHEAMLTLAVLPPGRLQRPNSWPDYLHEADDHGAYPDPDRKERPHWQPSARHIDELHVVLGWYGSWKGADRRVNGIFKWEYALLEVRATQHLCGKPSWRNIALAMEMIPKAPNRSYRWWLDRHADLVQIAEFQACLLGDIKHLERAA